MESGVDKWKRDEEGTVQLVKGRRLANRSVLVAMIIEILSQNDNG